MQVKRLVNLIKNGLSLITKISLYIKSSSNKGCGNVYNYLMLFVLFVLAVITLWITLWTTCGQHVDNFGW